MIEEFFSLSEWQHERSGVGKLIGKSIFFNDRLAIE